MRGEHVAAEPQHLVGWGRAVKKSTAQQGDGNRKVEPVASALGRREGSGKGLGGVARPREGTLHDRLRVELESESSIVAGRLEHGSRVRDGSGECLDRR